MIQRTLEHTILESLAQFPVTGILGARQVGKTTLAKNIIAKSSKAVYLDLEMQSDLHKLRDPELYLRQHSDFLVVIDEIQRMPELFPLMRALIDRERRPGRFLILGSAGRGLLKDSSESLAGRIIYHELSPFRLEEIGSTGKFIERLWLRGGFPESFLASDDKASLKWRNAFIRTFLERDIPQFGIHVPAMQLRRILTMICHQNAQLFNASHLSRSLGVSAPTVKHYMDILEQTFIVRKLFPFHANIRKRLVKTPKYHVRDSGILHALLNLETMESLMAHPVIGHSWESFVLELIIGKLPDNCEYFFFRSSTGNEIDLVFRNSDHDLIAVEVKYSLSPDTGRGFRQSLLDTGCSHAYIVYPGEEKYQVDKNITVLPACELSKDAFPL